MIVWLFAIASAVCVLLSFPVDGAAGVVLAFTGVLLAVVALRVNRGKGGVR